MNDFSADTERIALQLRQLDRNLTAAAEHMALQGAGILAESVRERAPRRSGKLETSIGAADIGATQPGASVAKVFVREFYAWFVEYGTRKMPAQPFFRVGIRAAMDKAIAAMRKISQEEDGL